MEFLFIALVLWFVVAPLLTLLHELGHAVAALTFTRSGVRIELGGVATPFTRRFGRLTLVLRVGSGFAGYYWTDGRAPERWQRIAIILAGPMTSLACTCLSFGMLAGLNGPPEEVNALLFWCGNGAAVQFLVTVLPLRYPKWWAGYAGLASDGERLRRELG